MLRVSLSPSPGFCIKSTCTQDGIYDVPVTDEGPAVSVPAQKGLKVFVNICYDESIPPPPEGSEDVIQRAMRGEDTSLGDNAGWFVPVVVSNGREDKDKAGKLSLVFDAVFHTSIKPRVSKDGDFKMFIIELALQRIEARSSLPLSRQIGMPNIKSKGALTPCTVLIPPALYPAGHPIRAGADSTGKRKPLIEEVEAQPASAPPAPRSILKKTQAAPSTVTALGVNPEPVLDQTLETPAWTWSRMDNKLQIRIQVPKLTHAAVPASSLDIEPARLWLNIPGLYSLTIDMTLSDATIQGAAKTAVSAVNAAQALALKRKPQVFDVDDARAEWRVAEGLLVVFV